MTQTNVNYGRLAIFIDGSNFYHTIRDLNLHVDYRRLLEHFGARGSLVRAFSYTALLDNDQTPDWLIRLTDWLAYNGFQVVPKRAKLFRRRVMSDLGEAHWINEVKGNVDIELTVDLMALAAISIPQSSSVAMEISPAWSGACSSRACGSWSSRASGLARAPSRMSSGGRLTSLSIWPRLPRQSWPDRPDPDGQ